LESVIIISVLGGLILFLLAAGKPGRLFRFIGNSAMKLVMGALFLFFLNAIGNQFGLYVPINWITAAVSGFLGLPGAAALAVIQMYIIP
jgi:inhibitor of the pro-sigma K processing machinery